MRIIICSLLVTFVTGALARVPVTDPRHPHYQPPQSEEVQLSEFEMMSIGQMAFYCQEIAQLAPTKEIVEVCEALEKDKANVRKVYHSWMDCKLDELNKVVLALPLSAFIQMTSHVDEGPGKIEGGVDLKLKGDTLKSEVAPLFGEVVTSELVYDSQGILATSKSLPNEKGMLHLALENFGMRSGVRMMARQFQLAHLPREIFLAEGIECGPSKDPRYFLKK